MQDKLIEHTVRVGGEVIGVSADLLSKLSHDELELDHVGRLHHEDHGLPLPDLDHSSEHIGIVVAGCQGGYRHRL